MMPQTPEHLRITKYHYAVLVTLPGVSKVPITPGAPQLSSLILIRLGLNCASFKAAKEIPENKSLRRISEC